MTLRILPPLYLGALSVAGGALWGLCFGREPLVLAPWIALVPLFFLCERPGWAFVHGLSFWLVSIPWIAHTLETYGEMAGSTAVILLVVLASYLAAYSWLFALLGRPLWRQGGGVAWLGLPAVWVALEWLRGVFLSGFPWNLAAYAWVDVPGVLPLSAWIGSHGISFLLLFVNSGIALAVASRRWEIGAWSVLVALLLFAAALRWAIPEQPAIRTQGARIVQPATPILSVDDVEVIQFHYAKLFRLSHAACERDVLVLWPESAAWPFSLETSAGLRRDVSGLVSRGCSLLLNSQRVEDGEVFNTVYLIDDDGEGVTYDKHHLVPFGEYVPLRDLLPFVDSLSRNVGDFTPGSGLDLLPWGRERLGIAICFESIFPTEVAFRVQAGATVLVTVTNDAWYGDSAAPWQHFRAARFRAAENARPLLRAALTGVSGVVRADGSVRSLLGVGEEGVLDTRVRGRTGLTPYTRLPWLVPLLAVVGGGFAIFWSVRRKGR